MAGKWFLAFWDWYINRFFVAMIGFQIGLAVTFYNLQEQGRVIWFIVAILGVIEFILISWSEKLP